MQLRYCAFVAPKAGHTVAELEDAYAPESVVADLGVAFRCAVADGATQGSHSGPWAQALCAEFCAQGQTEALVPTAQARFIAWEKQYVAGREANARPLQWFESEVMASGAYATLVGVTFAATQDQVAFTAVAVGDSCLFVVRQEKIAASFPLTESSQFRGAPILLASHQAQQPGFKELSGELSVGDGVLLCTDALAAWTMQSLERGEDPLPRLLAVLGSSDRTSFDALLAELRQARLMRNDDVTLAFAVVEA